MERTGRDGKGRKFSGRDDFFLETRPFLVRDKKFWDKTKRHQFKTDGMGRNEKFLEWTRRNEEFRDDTGGNEKFLRL